MGEEGENLAADGVEDEDLFLAVVRLAKGEVNGPGAAQVFKAGAVLAPEGNPLKAEVQSLFQRRPAEGGFGLPGEGRVEPVFGDDATGKALAEFDPDTGVGVHTKGQCIMLSRDTVLFYHESVDFVYAKSLFIALALT